jgi:dihydropteroate synthase
MKIHLSSKRVLTLEKKTKMNFTCRDFRLDLSTPKLMGVLNITPDSFSDGGRFFSNNKIDLDKAVETALQMQKDGATIIDIGGESTRPNATPVSAEEEMRRTVPLIEKLAKVIEIPISIDTYKSSVAEAALKAGASLVNDISGFRLDGALADVCAKIRCACYCNAQPTKAIGNEVELRRKKQPMPMSSPKSKAHFNNRLSLERQEA